MAIRAKRFTAGAIASQDEQAFGVGLAIVAAIMVFALAQQD